MTDEVACFANTPGGGALILGVEDSQGTVLGTELDIEWLRQRIDEAVQVAPDIVEHHLGGAQGLRVLVLYVPQAKEPVYDTGISCGGALGITVSLLTAPFGGNTVKICGNTTKWLKAPATRLKIFHAPP